MGKISPRFHALLLRVYKEDMAELSRHYPKIPINEVIRSLVHEHVKYLNNLEACSLPVPPIAHYEETADERHSNQ